MTPWLMFLIAIISTTVCLLLWFRDVRRVMRGCKSTVESAASQLAVCREKALKAQGDPEIAAVYERSAKIYRQAVDIYNRTLQKPWHYLPALLMGFRYIQ